MTNPLPSACQSLLIAAKMARKDYQERQEKHDELIEKMVAVTRQTDPALADEYLAVLEHIQQDEEFMAQVAGLFGAGAQE